MTFEVDVIVRATLLLAMVGLGAVLLRRASASLRHAVWTMGLAAVLALPAVMAFLPSGSIVSLPLLPAAEPPALRSGVAADAAGPETPESELALAPIPERYSSADSEAGAARADLWQILDRQRPSRWTVLSVVRGVWLTGFLLLLARWLVALAQLRKLRLRSRPLDEDGWLTPLRALQQELRVTREVSLRMVEDELPPMAWGFFRPLILLPASAAGWPTSLRRMALAHELAHVKRSDGLSQALCQVACAVYWFNPLVWYAAHRLQAERERACDDYVLRLGHAPADYAGHLVEIARGLNSGFVRTAVSMAHPSELRSRIAAILNGQARRQRISAPVAASLLLTLSAFVIALSVVKITALAAMVLPAFPPPPVPLSAAEPPVAQTPAPEPAPVVPFASAAEMKTFINSQCAACHIQSIRDIQRSAFAEMDLTDIQSNAPVWEQVVRRLRTGLLSHFPFEPRPDPGETQRAALWLEAELDRTSPAHVASLGAHRLNRTEYANAIRDMLGLEIDAAAMFPVDDGSDWFDNQIVMLRTTPELERAYVSAADQIAERTLARHLGVPITQVAPAQYAIFACTSELDALHAGAGISFDQRRELQRKRLVVQEECARTILKAIATRAFRRDPGDGDIGFLMDLYRQSADGEFTRGLRTALRSILADRRFLYRTESEPAGVQPKQPYRINDFDLASRLSFFLWSSIPDERLLDLARRGALREPATLERETRRMLEDPRAEALALNFAEQWLGVRWFKRRPVANQVVPDLDPALWQSMRREFNLFFGSVAREDRPVPELLTADYTFVDARLAQHYGLPAAGDEFRRVTLPPALDARRGLIGKAAIQVAATNPYTDINIVQRGIFVLRLLGLEAVPPPPNVPETTPRVVGDPHPPTTRQRLEKELSLTRACLPCHAPIDPLGNALGNFDLNGRWQTEEWGQPIDTSVVLVTGAKLNGVADLRQTLASHSDEFVQVFTERLMVYALGRGLDYRDMPAIRAITRDAARGNNRFSAVILAIVSSPTFQMNAKP